MNCNSFSLTKIYSNYVETKYAPNIPKTPDDWASQCTLTIAPTDIKIEVHVYDSSIHIRDFLNPIHKFTRFLTSVEPKTSSYLDTQIYMNQMEITTDRGMTMKDMQSDFGIEIERVDSLPHPRILTNNEKNSYWKLELLSGNRH